MSDHRSSSAADGGVSRRRPRRKRSVTESLLSIVLVLEAFVLFFASLTMFGLKVFEPAFPAWVALPVGAVGILLFLVTTAVLRYQWGIAIGWVLQGGLVALGILTPFMYVVGGGFALLWIYCFTRGRRIDRGGARATASSEEPNQGEPS